MDQVPYNFIDRVFTMMNHRTIRDNINRNFKSAVWNEAARVYKNRVRPIFATMYLATDGFKCSFVEFGAHGAAHTFEELQRLDHRYHRITALSVKESATKMSIIDVQGLPAVIELVSRFALDSLNLELSDNVDFKDNRQLLLAELTKHDISAPTQELSFSSYTVDFLKNQMRRESMQQLTLSGVWPPEIKEDLLAFICRPQFLSLESDYQCFELEDIKRIVAYNKSLEHPWKESTVFMRANQDYSDEIATAIIQTGADEMGDDVEIEVCYMVGYCNITFTCEDVIDEDDDEEEHDAEEHDVEEDDVEDDDVEDDDVEENDE